MIFLKSSMPEMIELRHSDDIQFTYCDNWYEFGILVHSRNRTYMTPSFSTEDCETFFIFRGKKYWTHEINKKEFVKIPNWVKNWVSKNDFRSLSK